MKQRNVLEKIEEEIVQVEVAEQRKVLQDLPRLLKVSMDDILLLNAAENSFDFSRCGYDEFTRYRAAVLIYVE